MLKIKQKPKIRKNVQKIHFTSVITIVVVLQWYIF